MDTSDCSENIKEFFIECVRSDENNEEQEISNLQECGIPCGKNPGHESFTPIHDLFSCLIFISTTFSKRKVYSMRNLAGFITDITSDDLLENQIVHPKISYFLMTTETQFLTDYKFCREFFIYDINAYVYSVNGIKVIESNNDYSVILCTTKNNQLSKRVKKYTLENGLKLFNYISSDKPPDFEIHQHMLSKMSFIKNIADKTVRLKVCYVSTKRPDSDVLAAHRGKSGNIHYGTGFVIEMDAKDRLSGESGENSNSNCRYFSLVTANHVIFDDLEAEQTHIDFFYDSTDGRGVGKARGVKLIDSNTDGDYSVVLCVTDDKEQCDMLNGCFGEDPFIFSSANKQTGKYFQRNQISVLLSKLSMLCFSNSCNMEAFYIYLSQVIKTIKTPLDGNTANIVGTILLCLASNSVFIKDFFVKFVQEAKSKLWSGGLIEHLEHLNLEHLNEKLTVIPTDLDMKTNDEISKLVKKLLVRGGGTFENFLSVIKEICVKICPYSGDTWLSDSSLFQETENSYNNTKLLSNELNFYNILYLFRHCAKWLNLVGFDRCEDNSQNMLYILVNLKLTLYMNIDCLDFLMIFADEREFSFIKRLHSLFCFICRQLEDKLTFDIQFGSQRHDTYENFVKIFELNLQGIKDQCEGSFTLWMRQPLFTNQNYVFHVSHPHGKEKQITFGEVKELTTSSGFYELRYDGWSCASALDCRPESHGFESR